MKLSLPRYRTWFFPGLLFLVCIASFGLLIPQLGFYWDDWAKTLVHRVFGLSGYWSYYAEDRPISGWTHIFLISIFGDAPVYWHIFCLLMRWVSAVCLWWCVRLIWPEADFPAKLASILFVIYPVFTQQAIAVTFHQQWMQYALYLTSLGLMVAAFQNSRWKRVGLTILACSLMVVQLTITEYFIGLELLRPLILWILISKKHRQFCARLGKTLLHSAPYLVLVAGYAIYRLFFIRLTGEDPYRAETLYNFFQSPLSTTLDLVKIISVETYTVLFSTWAKVLDPGDTPVLEITRFVKLTWLAGAVTALISLAFMVWPKEKTGAETSNKSYLWQMALIGLAGILAGCLPGWITGRNVIVDFHSNRYAMPAMFGASLVWAALIDWIGRGKFQKSLLACALVALAVGFHLRVANDYVEIWKNEMRFFWQLSWRAPYIQPKTALIMDEEIFPNQGLFSTSAALNLLYPQPGNQDTLAYWIYTLRPRYNAPLETPVNFNFKTQFRTLKFQGGSPDTLLVYFNPGQTHCVWVLSEQDRGDPVIPAITSSLLGQSNLSRVLSQPAAEGYPPQDLFGTKPGGGWCYLYEKADLARQLGDWQTVVDLAGQAKKQGFSPLEKESNSPHEWIPFIEGYARAGMWDEAAKLTTDSFQAEPAYRKMLCSTWTRLISPSQTPQAAQGAYQQVNDHLQCAQNK